MFKNPERHARLILPAVFFCFCVFFINSTQPELKLVEINADLNQFQNILEDRFAYLKVNDADYKSAIRLIREKATSGMEIRRFGIELSKVLALFVDCHAGVSGYTLPEGYLPFLIEPVGDRYLAVKSDRSGFVNNTFPYITKIDGKNMDYWLGVLKQFIAKGSPQLVKARGLRLLGYIQFARSEAGFEKSSELTLELESKDKTEIKTVELNISDRMLAHTAWPETESGVMENNIGYLRITLMNQNAFDLINTWMPKFRETDGLIIDVRDNMGGTRRVLDDLFPYFCKASDKPVVANVSKYVLYSGFTPGYLDSRRMFTLDWSGWNPAEKKAVEDFIQTFKPEWKVPETGFSDWHYWVLSKKTNPDAYDYSKPVVFLMNQNGFSAADVILSSVKGFRNITLVGLPSGGGSGAARSWKLNNSNLRVRLSSMASFQSDGRLFDSRGVEPDMFLGPVPEYFLKNGPDNMLDRAVQIILGGK
ncbi:S41 family peptidase [candidate division KSB1 bacterium]